MSGSGSEQLQTVRPWPDQAPMAPPPPPGPGVQPPFVAPPTDGTRQRRWMAAGLSAGAAVLLCVAGGLGFAGLIYLGVQSLGEQAQGAVVDYLTALRDEEYGQAYVLLCDDLQATMSPSEFARTSSEGPRVQRFDVGQASFVTDPVEVPATINYADGDVRSVRFAMFQDTSTGTFEVCGEAD
jgi:hypothetical protein